MSRASGPGWWHPGTCRPAQGRLPCHPTHLQRRLRGLPVRAHSSLRPGSTSGGEPRSQACAAGAGCCVWQPCRSTGCGVWVHHRGPRETQGALTRASSFTPAAPQEPLVWRRPQLSPEACDPGPQQRAPNSPRAAATMPPSVWALRSPPLHQHTLQPLLPMMSPPHLLRLPPENCTSPLSIACVSLWHSLPPHI